MSKPRYLAALGQRTRRARRTAVILLVTFALTATGLTVSQLVTTTAQPASMSAGAPVDYTPQAQAALASIGTQLELLTAARQAWDALPAAVREHADAALKAEIDRRLATVENLRQGLTTALANGDLAARATALRPHLATAQRLSWSPDTTVLRDAVLALTPKAPADKPQQATSVPIRKGDTLWALARTHGTTVATLQRLNKLGRSTLIRAGATLRLPGDATPQATTKTRPANTTKARPAANPAKGVSLKHSTPRIQTGKPGDVGGPVREIAARVFGPEFSCAAAIINRESGWNHRATNKSSGAYGLPQALPAAKMASAGPNWRDDPETQLRWMHTYMKKRYGGACDAWAFWQKHKWY